jgi:hypothetical protein
MATRSKAWTLFVSSSVSVVGSNPNRGMDVSVRIFCVLSCMSVETLRQTDPLSKATRRQCTALRSWKSGQSTRKVPYSHNKKLRLAVINLYQVRYRCRHRKLNSNGSNKTQFIRTGYENNRSLGVADCTPHALHTRFPSRRVLLILKQLFNNKSGKMQQSKRPSIAAGWSRCCQTPKFRPKHAA